MMRSTLRMCQSSLFHAALCLLVVTSVRTDAVVGNYDAISSGEVEATGGSEIFCSSSNVRLVAYNGVSYGGTPMVLHNGVWGTIDNDYWDMEDANVFCNELGMGDAVSISYGQYGQSYGTQWVGFSCNGLESSLQDCDQAYGGSDWEVMDYGSVYNPNYDDAGVRCSHEPLDIDGCGSSGYAISTVAGTGNTSYSSVNDYSDATSVNLYNPFGVAMDTSSNLYITDTQHSVIYKVNKYGKISTFAGDGSAGYSNDSVEARLAMLNRPKGVAVSSTGEVYIADTGNHRIRLVTPPMLSSSCRVALMSYNGVPYEGTPMVLHNGVWGTIDNDYWDMYDANVFCNELGMGDAVSISYGEYGPSYVTQWYGFVCDGAESSLQDCNLPYGYWDVMDYGSVNNPNYDDAGVKCSYASTDANGGCLYDGTFFYSISTIIGTGVSGSSGDGTDATSASLSNPSGLALDSSGNVYVADGGNSRIRKVTKSTGIINTYAGGGDAFRDNVAATSTTLSSIIGISVGSSDNVYVADGGNNRIRKIARFTGIVTTIAGTGDSGYSGDDGPATNAALSNPSGVAVYVTSSYPILLSVFIADTGNNCIRKVDMSNSVIVTIAGTGASGFSGDYGPATNAKLSSPSGVAVDSKTGDLYIADNGNMRIRRVYYSTPSSSMTFAPSTPHLTSFPLLMTVSNWPYDYVAASSEQAISSLIADVTDTSTVNLNLTISEESSQRRKLLSSYR